MPTTNAEMQQEIRLRLEGLEDKGDWKHEWAKLFLFVREIVVWAVVIAFICFVLLFPAAGIFWLVYQIPGIGRLEGPIEVFITVAVTAPLVGGFFFVLSKKQLTKEALIWEYHYDLRNLETIKQRDEIIGLRKRLGLPTEDNE